MILRCSIAYFVMGVIIALLLRFLDSDGWEAAKNEGMVNNVSMREVLLVVVLLWPCVLYFIATGKFNE